MPGCTLHRISNRHEGLKQSLGEAQCTWCNFASLIVGMISRHVDEADQ